MGDGIGVYRRGTDTGKKRNEHYANNLHLTLLLVLLFCTRRQSFQGFHGQSKCPPSCYSSCTKPAPEVAIPRAAERTRREKYHLSSEQNVLHLISLTQSFRHREKSKF